MYLPISRLTNTKQAQLPSEERVGDVLRDSEEVIAVCALDRQLPHQWGDE